MFHAYTQYNRHQQHPFALYKALGSRPRVQRLRRRFTNCVCRDAPRLRRVDRHTVGMPGLDNYIGDELHPYCSFVEGFNGGRVCSVNYPASGACTQLAGNGMIGRWTSKHSEGLVPLFKEDFQVLPGGGLALYHPRFVNKTAFVVFVLNNCPECQDTKQMWQAYAIEGHQLVGGNGTLGDVLNTRICTLKVQFLMFKRRDGELVDYVGPFNASRLRQLLKHTCLNYY